MAFEVTTSLRKMLDMKARKKVIQGATSSGKTYGIIPIIYDKCLATPRLKVTVVAETLPAVKEGCVDIFKNFMMDEGRWMDEQWNATELVYTALNKSKIQFKSFDSVGKAKAAGKRDILFLNEGNHIPYPIADALIIRSQEVWIDFNADSEFWAHTEILQQPNSEFLKLTYLDNEAIPSPTLEDLLYKKMKAEQEDARGQRGYWWNWWQVYGLGEIGNLQGVVFNNWSQVDKIPEYAKLLGYGLDYGYRNDPTALVAIYYADNIYYLDELIYQTGLLNQAISNKMIELGVDRYTTITGDSAEMKSNDELQTLGWRMQDAKKGADSIVYGVSRMQELDLRVTSRSLNLINEFRKYTWATDRDGNATNKPIDNYNHCFTGDTLVTTIKGDIPIKDIKIGDLVLTSQGYRRVLKKFNNGVKQISKYSMQFDTFSVSLRSTKEHKVKTKEGWKEISKLKKNDVLYQCKYLTEKSTTCMKENDTFLKVVQDYIRKFGNITKEIFQKVITFIMLTVILPITILSTLILFWLAYIFAMKVKNDLKTILNGLKISMQKELRKLKSGTLQKKEGNGIENTLKNLILETKHTEKKNASYVNQSLHQKQMDKNSVQTNVSQNTEENQELIISKKYVLNAEKYLSVESISKQRLVQIAVETQDQEQVYDLMIDDCHEYFANGILVHNCIDAIRYYFQTNTFSPDAPRFFV